MLMFYVLLVSHGEFAPGLHTALKMIAGDRDNVLSVSLRDGMSVAGFAQQVKQVIAAIKPEDRILVLADILGGSPLTTTMQVLGDAGLLARTKAIGGMNLPLALAAVLSGENLDDAALVPTLLAETKKAVQELQLAADDDDDDI
jgi:PTS system N-acetylgalactosamine-specific IIA component